MASKREEKPLEKESGKDDTFHGLCCKNPNTTFLTGMVYGILFTAASAWLYIWLGDGFFLFNVRPVADSLLVPGVIGLYILVFFIIRGNTTDRQTIMDFLSSTLESVGDAMRKFADDLVRQKQESANQLIAHWLLAEILRTAQSERITLPLESAEFELSLVRGNRDLKLYVDRQDDVVTVTLGGAESEQYPMPVLCVAFLMNEQDDIDGDKNTVTSSVLRSPDCRQDVMVLMSEKFDSLPSLDLQITAGVF